MNVGKYALSGQQNLIIVHITITVTIKVTVIVIIKRCIAPQRIELLGEGGHQKIDMINDIFNQTPLKLISDPLKYIYFHRK